MNNKIFEKINKIENKKIMKKININRDNDKINENK